MNLKVLKKSAVYLIGNFSSKVLMAIIIPIYAFYVKSSDLGYFDYSQTLMYIIIPIAFCSIWEAILKFTIDAKYEKTEIINSAILLSIFACIIITVGMIAVDFFVDIQHFVYILLMFVIYGLVQIWLYAARGLNDSGIYVISGIVGTLVNFGSIFILVVWCRLGLRGLFVSYILSQLSTIVVIEIKLRLLKNIRLNRNGLEPLKKMIVFSAPLTLNTISTWVLTGFSRVIINSKLGAYENGLYAFANKFAIVISMLGSVITMAVIEEAIISTKDKTQRDNEGKNAAELYIVLLCVAAVAVPAIKLFYHFIAESEYFSSFVYVPFLLLYASISTLASNIGAQFQALEITRYQFISTIIGSLFTIVISVLFIGTYGVAAVAFSQLVGVSVMAAARYIMVKKHMYYKINLLKLFLATIAYVALSMICVKASTVLVIVLLIVSLIAALLINYRLIRSLLKRRMKQ